jgi:ribosomal protein S18 acetylase RimI-like enzyme
MAPQASHAVTLRPVTTEDRGLLYSVYASTREGELAGVDWTEEEKAAFLLQQFKAQDRHYREQYDGAVYDVIEVDGRPAGRLYVARWADEIRIMDISLLPENRGLGIGTALLRNLLHEGARTGKWVTVHVEQFNPARGLYERLGFRRVRDVGVYVLMQWSSGPPGANQANTDS